MIKNKTINTKKNYFFYKYVIIFENLNLFFYKLIF